MGGGGGGAGSQEPNLSKGRGGGELSPRVGTPKKFGWVGVACFFSNSLIIQKPTTKEIMHHDVFGRLLNFPFKISLFEKLYQTLVTVSHHNIKNLEVH